MAVNTWSRVAPGWTATSTRTPETSRYSPNACQSYLVTAHRDWGVTIFPYSGSRPQTQGSCR